MTNTKTEIWKTVLVAVKELQTASKEVVLYNDAEKLFNKNFEYYYDMISNNFMAKEQTKNSLDRHKVAAIIICSLLKAKIVGVGKDYLETCKDKEFLGNEKIAFEVALSYMHTELERDFEKGEVPYENIFNKYVFPTPYSCNRKYGEVICRDLYFSDQFYDLNPLLLSNLLFFIEDYSFTVLGIKRKST